MTPQLITEPFAALLWIIVMACPFIVFIQAMLLRGACFMMDRISPNRDIAELPMAKALGVVVLRVTISFFVAVILQITFWTFIGNPLGSFWFDSGLLFVWGLLMLTVLTGAAALTVLNRMDFGSSVITCVVDGIFQFLTVGVFIVIGVVVAFY